MNNLRNIKDTRPEFGESILLFTWHLEDKANGWWQIADLASCTESAKGFEYVWLNTDAESLHVTDCYWKNLPIKPEFDEDGELVC